jgi:hypothetical protein
MPGGHPIGANELFIDGVLGVDASEKVEALLERFMRVGWSLKHNGRKLTTTVGARRARRCWHVKAYRWSRADMI